MNRDYYIQMISLLSDKYGNELIEMLDYYKKHSLREITENEAKEYYENLVDMQKSS